MTSLVVFFSITILSMCIAFPIYHMIHSLLPARKSPYYMKNKKRVTEKPISILVPCYNEQSILQTTIKGIERLNYHNFEFILINDGSSDHTLQVMKELLDLEPFLKERTSMLEFMPIRGIYRSKKNPRILILDKENGGKADSLNAGIAYASHEIIITLDADSVLDEQALPIINQAFQDPFLIAAGGMVHVLQGRRYQNGIIQPSLNVKTIVRLQILEYMRGFYIYKSSLSRANALSIISGAFGAFKREVLIAVGGYRKTVGEDIDITIRIQNYKNKQEGSKVIFIPEAVCYTEVPEKWRDLYKQRIRWQKAFTDCIVIYFKELLTSFFKNPISFFLLIDALFVGVICSFFTVTGMIFILLFNDYSPIYIVLLLISLHINLCYSLISLIHATHYRQKFSYKDVGPLLITLMADLLLYRFITIHYILMGSLLYFFNKDNWNKVERTGREYNIEQAG